MIANTPSLKLTKQENYDETVARRSGRGVAVHFHSSVQSSQGRNPTPARFTFRPGGRKSRAALSTQQRIGGEPEWAVTCCRRESGTAISAARGDICIVADRGRKSGTAVSSDFYPNLQLAGAIACCRWEPRASISADCQIVRIVANCGRQPGAAVPSDRLVCASHGMSGLTD
jgi:hypothetical protein